MISLVEGDVVVVDVDVRTASKRTRNRVKENGPEFEFVKFGQTYVTIALGNSRAALLKSRTTRWVGWLPEREIVLKKL